MQDYKEAFRGKKVTVLGLGLLGRGVGDAAFLARCGAEVTVTDKKTEAELAESVAKLKEHPGIVFHLGGHVIEDFTKADVVIKAAGVRLDSPEIAAARAAEVPVMMSTALFAKYAMEAGATIVGVTGTRGKSTVSQMIYHTLQKTIDRHRSLKEKKIFLGGNVRGVSTLALLPQVQEGDIAVLELDSWQLQGFGDAGISPQVSVCTNLMPDHQNYYANMDEYFADKANIFRYQREGDHLFAGLSVMERVNAARPKAAPLVPPAIPEEWALKIVGGHNRENAAFAVAVLRALDINDEDIRAGIESFEAVEGRLQFVREIPVVSDSESLGVKIYNDNNATTPEATIAALRALDTGKKNIVLIMGGADKGLDTSYLLYDVAKMCKRVILLAGSGSDKIVPFIADYSIYENLEAAVRESVASASGGDIILFSPSFASFGMFKNEYERNDRFMNIVRGL